MTYFAFCLPCEGTVPMESLNGILECAYCGEATEIVVTHTV